MQHPKLEEVIRRDPRYPYEAYEFIFAALAHTQKLLGHNLQAPAEIRPEHHVRGPQLVMGIIDFARREFGLMARTVFRMWGINASADFGEIVFNLIDAGLMSKTDEDDRADFRDVVDLDRVLVENYEINAREEAEEER